MLTLLASLMGFASSALPKLLNLYQDKHDRTHELAILEKQLEQMRLGHNQRLAEIQTQADITNTQALYQHDGRSSGIAWVEGLRASVRPIVTYLFMLLFIIVKVASLIALLQQGVTLTASLQAIWDTETHALFAAIISFWFGHRTFKQ